MSPNGNPARVAPIADLSYRNYDGPLHSRSVRWWIVAVANIRLTARNRWFWWLSIGSLAPYVLFGLFFYFTHMFAAASPTGAAESMGPLYKDKNGHQYAMLFYQCVASFSPTWLFGIALLVGAGSIASDNRANALQVYLSKPITKGDYLLGKWMGVFLPVTMAALLPALVLFACMGMAYSSDGFFHKEPTLIWRILAAGMIPGAVHASLILGFSAWSKTARLAGAFYAGVFFVGDIIVPIFTMVANRMDPSKDILLQHLCISGAISGLAQNIFGVTIVRSMFHRHAMQLSQSVIPAPNAWALGAITLGACAVAVAAARWRIRAVEVVRG
ncbi:MAG TPA: ABC transporter permease subunit [Armatimonadota bacterium]|jgi:ABC-2 type transport system permease protein